MGGKEILKGKGRKESSLYGLVLAGGLSQRMKADKTQFVLNGQLLFERAFGLLDVVCDQVYVSCREDQAKLYRSHSYILDRFGHVGPIGGIASALSHDIKASWLVLAADMPNMNLSTLDLLTKQERTGFDAIAYRDDSGRWQPLCAIYTPPILPKISKQIVTKKYSLQKLLSDVDGHALEVKDTSAFLNINTMEDWSGFMGIHKN